MALNKYTQADVAAMIDAELSRLASVLRFGREITWDIWSPATDRNQSGELLQFAAHKGAAFTINLICSTDAWIYSSVNTLPGQIKISGATARAETIAAVCALLALEGRLA